MAADRVVLVEGDEDVVWQFTIKEDGTAVDLSGGGTTVELYVTDEGATSNRVDAGSCANLTSSGTCTYTFTAANCTISSGDTVKGHYRLKTTIGGEIRYRDEGEFVLEKNRHI